MIELLDPASAWPWLAVFGRAHPVLLHLPLGILPALALLEFGAPLCRRELPRGPILALAALGGVCALLAGASGYVLGGEHGGRSGGVPNLDAPRAGHVQVGAAVDDGPNL